MKTRFLVASILSLSFCLNSLAQTMPSDADPALWARAMKLHKSSIIVDGHNDITGPMVDQDLNLATDTKGMLQLGGEPIHTDINRLKASGITGEFMSIYVGGDTWRAGRSHDPSRPSLNRLSLP